MRRSRLAGLVAPLLLALGLGFTQAASAQAASNSGGYVALGDSYASGVGAGSYISSSGDCDRSTNAAAYLWNAAHKPASFAFNACSGATTDDVLANQLGSLNSSTSLVSISIGGNDAGFADVMQTCVLSSDSTCLSRISTATSYITNTLPGKLDTVYNAIHSKAPNARVVVVGYPRFYLLGQTCLGLSDTKRSAINNAADTLDGTIQSRVQPMASSSATSAPPSPATRSAPATPGCTASTSSTSPSPTTPPPPVSRAATCRRSPTRPADPNG